jgi:hypothetical protein
VGIPDCALNRFSNKVNSGVDMSRSGKWPHSRRSRSWGGENCYFYLRLGPDQRPMGIPSTYAA